MELLPPLQSFRTYLTSLLCFNTIFYIIACFHLLCAVLNVSWPSWTIYIFPTLWKDRVDSPGSLGRQNTAEPVRTGRGQGKAEKASSVPFSRVGKREMSLSCWRASAATAAVVLGASQHSAATRSICLSSRASSQVGEP